MKTILKFWFFFGIIIVGGVIALSIEYWFNRFPIFGLVLLGIGVIGWLIAEIELEIRSHRQN